MEEKHTKDSLRRYALFFIYVTLAALLGAIIVASITKPQHNLFAWQMCIGTFLATAILIACFILWEKYIPAGIAGSSWLYWSLFLLYGALLYGVSCFNRNAPESLVDYGQVWRAASEIAEGKKLSGETYFRMYANNIKPMLLLSVLFRAASFIGFQDPFYFVLILSVAEVMAAVWAVGILAGHSAEERRRYRIPVLLMFVFLLPIWANVQAFYTDSMSFCIGAVGLALMKLSYGRKRRREAFLLQIAAGILASIGITIKVTVAIPFIAGLLIPFLYKEKRKEIRGGTADSLWRLSLHIC